MSDSLDLTAAGQHMYARMLRNVATADLTIVDSSGTLTAQPGCIIAAPPDADVGEDHVFCWVRDAALAAFEIAAATPPGTSAEVLAGYVDFSTLCLDDAWPSPGQGSFRIDAGSRPWSVQEDGPAIQSCAVLAAWELLPPAAQERARLLVERNVDHLLEVYQQATTNLWEEHVGFSFFARSVQLRCFLEVRDNTVGIVVPRGVHAAIAWLESALEGHWTGSWYASVIGGDSPPGYDPNIDIVQAAVYGAVPCTDTRMLATLGALLAAWADPSSAAVYPINVADAGLGLGPVLGRYPGDTYDAGGPWPLCTANAAELLARLATAVTQTGAVPYDDLSAPLLTRLGISATTSAAEAAAALRRTADAMLRATVYHSDHLELGERLDGETGFGKGARDLTWSYAAFLSALRALQAGRAVA